MTKLFRPFEKINRKSQLTIRFGWLVAIILLWVISSFGETHLFPTPSQVLTGISDLFSEGLVVHIFSSLKLCAMAVFFSVFISLILCYLSPIPLLKNVAGTVSKMRYLPLAGISFYLSILISDARMLQIWILVIFMSTFFITTILSVINSIPEEEFDHAKTLGCSRWEMLLEVVIKGRFDYVIESVRQNLAIVWMMLVTVESMLAAAGGLGFLIKNSDRAGNQGRVIALQIIILFVGIGIDFALTGIRKLAFRFSKI